MGSSFHRQGASVSVSIESGAVIIVRAVWSVGCGHFTQVVWKSSRQLGVGKAKSFDARQVFVVCMYYPAGNYVGRYKDNVLPPPR